MGTVGMVLAGQLRHRWRSWLAMSILVSLVCGVVMAAAAAGRRTDAAFPGFLIAHGFDVEVYSVQPQPRLARLPGVSSVLHMVGPDNGQPTCACTHPINPSDFGVIVLPPGGPSPFQLVSGRLPDRSDPDEVIASYTLQKDAGVRLGTVIRVPFYSRSQTSAYNAATAAPPRPTGPTIGFKVVGFEASEFDFPSGSVPSYTLYASSSLANTILPRIAVGDVYVARLRAAAAGLPRFNAAVGALGGTAYVQNLDSTIASVESSIHPQALGWWLLAALAALVGLAVIGQALGRQSTAESDEFPTVVALGATRRELMLIGAARNLAVGTLGALGGVAIAVLLSPIAPLGEARVAESSTGFEFDSLVLLVGALVAVVVVFGLGLWPAVRAARTTTTPERDLASTPSRIATGLWTIGAPISAVIGVRNAVERRRGRQSVPVASALLGTVLAVTALCGTAIFGSSLTHLTATPRLYGDAFQLNISNPNSDGVPDPVLLDHLEHDPAVTGITQGIALPAVLINKSVVGAIAGTALRGQLLIPNVTGHSPLTADEIALGSTTMRQVGARLGSIVKVTVRSATGGRRTVPFRVVGQDSLPVVGDAVSLGNGAVFTLTGYEDAVCPPGPQRATCRQGVVDSTNGGVLASFAPGPRGQAAINHYLRAYRSLATLAITPTSLINFGEAVNFPLVFGAILVVFGIATLLHLLVVSVSRNRREIGLLKVLGFVSPQIISTVCWQASTLALAGIAIGIPVGVIVGRNVWLAFAGNLGAVPVSVVPAGIILLLVGAVLVFANVVAVAPAIVAIRSKPSDLSRIG